MMSMTGHTPLPEGVTYRQLTYWVTQGLFPDEAEDFKPGPGIRRDLTKYEWDMLTYMVELRKMGLENKLAAKLARAFARGPILFDGAVVTYKTFIRLVKHCADTPR